MKKHFGSLKTGALLGVIIGIVFVVAASLTIVLVPNSIHQQALAEAKCKWDRCWTTGPGRCWSIVWLNCMGAVSRHLRRNQYPQ